MPKSIIVLVGPTASGKTALAERLACAGPYSLISADSQQVYRGLDIGTAKPVPATRSAWSLVDVAEPGEAFSAGAFCRLASEACVGAWDKGLVPLLCGGTGLYLKALLTGLVDLPVVPLALRLALVGQWHRDGLAPLLERLDAVDPASARCLDRANPRRVLRALEVFEATGRPLSAWQAAATRPALVPDRALWLGLDPEREALSLRIGARVEQSLADGWLVEVRGLAERYGDDLVARCAAIGYPEFLEHIRGRRSLDDAKSAVLSRTRQYARRQRTWFKAQPGVFWASEGEPLEALARSFMRDV